MPPDEDNESVDSSQEGSVVSEEGTEKQDTEEQLAFLFGEAVEQLLEKRYKCYTSHLVRIFKICIFDFCLVFVRSGQARLSALARLNKLCSENVLSAQLAGRYISLRFLVYFFATVNPFLPV